MEHGGELEEYYCGHIENGTNEPHVRHYMTIKGKNTMIAECEECHIHRILRQEEKRIK